MTDIRIYEPRKTMHLGLLAAMTLLLMCFLLGCEGGDSNGGGSDCPNEQNPIFTTTTSCPANYDFFFGSSCTTQNICCPRGTNAITFTVANKCAVSCCQK